MEATFTIRNFLQKHIYLLIISAWLITISFVIDHYWTANSSIKRAEGLIKSYVEKQEKDFLELLKDDKLISKISNHRTALSDQDIKIISEKKYFLFFYNNKFPEKPFYWNTQKILPSSAILSSTDKKGFITLSNGYYVWESYSVDDKKIVALIPIKWNYEIQGYSEFLKNDFAVSESVSDFYEIREAETEILHKKNVRATDLFRLYEKDSEEEILVKNNVVSILFDFIALILIIFFLNLFVIFVSSKYNKSIGAVSIIILVLLLHLISKQMWLPINLRQFDLFDPSKYGLKNIFSSLGDLVINVLLVLWLIIYFRTQIDFTRFKSKVSDGAAKWLLFSLSSVLIVCSTFFLSFLIRSLVVDSKIPFDVMDFFSLNKFTLFGFFTISLIIIVYYLLFSFLIDIIKPELKNNLLQYLAGIVIVSLLSMSLMIGHLDKNNFEFYLLIWLILAILLYNSYLSEFIFQGKVVASKLVFWLVFFSLSASIVIKNEIGKKDIENRLILAKSISEKSDPTKVYLVNSFFNGLTTFINPDRAYKLNNDFPGVDLFLDSLIGKSATKIYSDNYNTLIYGFSGLQGNSNILYYHPDFNVSGTNYTYDDLNRIFIRNSSATSIENLHYFEPYPNSIAYISKKVVYDTTSISPNANINEETTPKVLACYFILAIPQKSSFHTGLIEEKIFQNTGELLSGYSNSYSWAIYKRQESGNYNLIDSRNYYPFKYTLSSNEVNIQDYTLKKNVSNNELWYNAGGGEIILIVKEDSLLSTITFFSYFFCSFLILVSVIWLFRFIINTKLSLSKFNKYRQLSISNQIHATIILLCVLSFAIIGMATIWFFITKSDESNKEKAQSVISSARIEIEKIINFSDREQADFNNETVKYRLTQQLDKISEVNNMDLVIYSLEGDLIANSSSIASLFNKGIQSKKMNPIAYEHLENRREISFTQEESIGGLKYISNYIAVSENVLNEKSLSNSQPNSHKKVSAYLNIPYLESQGNLKKEISNFLVAIINLNAFIFLFAGIVSLLITQRISNSFLFISEKMKKINLTRQNEYIEWKRDDEIGLLVSEYNKMVNKLDESAEALAKTEREGAWKEMAKQVAHEIKNPLTPMKLNIQFLQKAISNNEPNVNELASKMSVMLIEQIDHLSNIANQFSQFANLSESKYEVFDFNELINLVIQLHNQIDNVQIVQNLTDEKIQIRADKTNINRLFTNLILNAIQSVPDSREAIIRINNSIANDHVIVEICDNGAGIDDEAIQKIFTPNFTTKNSGTGLGLAMCKKIVEQTGGEIWFETEKDKGTCFYVKLPVA